MTTFSTYYYQEARRFCLKFQRNNPNTPVTIVMDDEVIQRNVTIPSRPVDPPYARICGQDVALVLINGTLKTDRIVE